MDIELINNEIDLCSTCTKDYPACNAGEGVIFGSGEGSDNIACCNEYDALIPPSSLKLAQRWTSTETLPPDDGEYLVFFQERKAILYFNTNGWHWDNGTIMMDHTVTEISHWQDLPGDPT